MRQGFLRMIWPASWPRCVPETPPTGPWAQAAAAADYTYSTQKLRELVWKPRRLPGLKAIGSCSGLGSGGGLKGGWRREEKVGGRSTAWDLGWKEMKSLKKAPPSDCLSCALRSLALVQLPLTFFPYILKTLGSTFYFKNGWKGATYGKRAQGKKVSPCSHLTSVPGLGVFHTLPLPPSARSFGQPRFCALSSPWRLCPHSPCYLLHHPHSLWFLPKFGLLPPSTRSVRGPLSPCLFPPPQRPQPRC